ncbi:MAG: hypothetical protein MZU91_04615 [Desulfosudis oleivorans]|nr:hypothetical protein [Desulfosudis oleivorans]
MTAVLHGPHGTALPDTVPHLRQGPVGAQATIPSAPTAMPGSASSPLPFVRACGIPYPAEEGPDHVCGDCLTERSGTMRLRPVAVVSTSQSLLDAVHAVQIRRQPHPRRAAGPTDGAA